MNTIKSITPNKLSKQLLKAIHEKQFHKRIQKNKKRTGSEKENEIIFLNGRKGKDNL